MFAITYTNILSMECSSAIFCGIGEIAQFVKQHNKWSTEIAHMTVYCCNYYWFDCWMYIISTLTLFTYKLQHNNIHN